MRIAFDADVLIYAGASGHALGERVSQFLDDEEVEPVGSVLLLAEVLAGPMRSAAEDEVGPLLRVLSRVEMLPLDPAAGRLALGLAVAHGLHAADAAHLATAISAGAAAFLTNNRKDFPKSIDDIDILYPDDLPG